MQNSSRVSRPDDYEQKWNKVKGRQRKRKRRQWGETLFTPDHCQILLPERVEKAKGYMRNRRDKRGEEGWIAWGKQRKRGQGTPGHGDPGRERWRGFQAPSLAGHGFAFQSVPTVRVDTVVLARGWWQ